MKSKLKPKERTVELPYLLKGREVMQVLGISQMTLWRICRDGGIDSLKIGSARRYTLGSVEKYIKKRIVEEHYGVGKERKKLRVNIPGS